MVDLLKSELNGKENETKNWINYDEKLAFELTYNIFLMKNVLISFIWKYSISWPPTQGACC